MIKQCKTCNFFNVIDDDGKFGECRRYPPTKEVTDKAPNYMTFSLGAEEKCFFNTSQFYIQTSAFDWCGEWKERNDSDRRI